MPLPRLSLALSAVLLSSAFAVIGGACLSSTSSPPPPALHDGRYVLITAGAQLPPQVIFTDGTGRRIRVLADTIVFETGTHHYTEHGSIAITPVGGTEQAPSPIALGTQTYTASSSFEFDLPVTTGGAAHGIALSDNALDLRMADGSHWTLNLR